MKAQTPHRHIGPLGTAGAVASAVTPPDTAMSDTAMPDTAASPVVLSCTAPSPVTAPETPTSDAAPNAPYEAIALRNVSFSYDGTNPVLCDITLTIPRGQWVCLLGANGSGKSTLARLVNALALPDEGEVRIFGMPTSQPENLYAIRRCAGMVFQNPDDQLVSDTVERDVAFGPENLGLAPIVIRDAVTRALHTVGLDGFEKQFTRRLSGGQKQRVCLAGALALDPHILILDETDGMLDPKGRAELMRLVGKLKAQGYTILMVTHDMDEAAQADRVIVLNQGRLVGDGSPEDILAQPDMLRSYGLQPPVACLLAESLRTQGLDVPLTASLARLEEELCRLFLTA